MSPPLLCLLLRLPFPVLSGRFPCLSTLSVEDALQHPQSREGTSLPLTLKKNFVSTSALLPPHLSLQYSSHGRVML